MRGFPGGLAPETIAHHSRLSGGTGFRRRTHRPLSLIRRSPWTQWGTLSNGCERAPVTMRMGGALQKVTAVLQRPATVEPEEISADHMLDLSSRGLRHPPPPLFAFTHLLKLYLSGNRLRTLPEELSQLQCLRILALDSNKLEELPPPVCALRELCRLYLGSNRLQTLPRDLHKLENLKALWLENNFFRHFPPVLCKLPQLRALQLGDNRLRSLPVGLSSASTLRGLWLYGNRFEEFPKVLCRMDFLEVIDLDRNRILAFPNLEHLVHLSLLSYDHNPCCGVPQVAPVVTLVGDGAEEANQQAQRAMNAEPVEQNEECPRGILKRDTRP
uniref:leucine-rich repeat-containing protein 10B-like n=1 Tax=Myxine glutinosa TaxID=7769 RepID=UPI00358F75B4